MIWVDAHIILLKGALPRAAELIGRGDALVESSGKT
jgi:hypothetical protein